MKARDVNSHRSHAARILPSYVANPSLLTTLLILGVTVFLGFLIGTGLVDRHLVVMFVVMIVTAYLIGRRVKSENEPWLPGLMALGMMAKLAGASVRYYVLTVIYHGSGDAGRYNNFAIEIAETWRRFEVPDMTTVAFGSEGTRFTAWVTGLLYAPYQPSFQGGFWIFAFLAFFGQVLLYLALRKVIRSQRWKRFAILVFFWPTLVYWPSSIGKEALIMLFLGIGCWAAANLYESYKFRWLPLIAGSAFLMSMVRVHVAALFVGSLLLAALFSKHRRSSEASFRRAMVLVVGLVALIPLALGVQDKFGGAFDALSSTDVDPIFSDVGDITQQGGSSVSGGVIRSPMDIPAGILKVLFRPLPIEADNIQMLASSIEGTLLLGLLVWQLPNIWRNRRQIRRSPYLLFCVVYSSLFIWAWSAILNLGIIARQRSLVIPFVLALIAGLGWTSEDGKIKLDATSRMSHSDHALTTRSA